MTDPAFATLVRGRTYSFPDHPVPLPSLTSLLDLRGKPQLDFWRREEVAKYAVEHSDAWLGLPAEDAVELLRESPWRKTRRAGDRGTSIHELLEHGEVPDPENPVHPYVVAGLAWKNDHCERVFRTELTLRHLRAGYAGTADAIAEVDGQVAVVDWKSSKTTGYIDQGLQLVGLARCEQAVGDDGHPSVWTRPATLGVIVWLRPDGTYGEYRLDLTSPTADLLFDAVAGLAALWRADQSWGRKGKWL